jgi:hypothetical protein
MDNKNLIVYGRMERHPTSFSQVHTLRFINVDEQAFVGAPAPNNTNNMGSMIPSTTDIGLWVLETGIQDDIGTPKAGWNRTGDDPTWVVGDEMKTTPWNVGDYSTYAAHTKGGVLQSIDPGNGVTYTQEAFNLTRNVITEGTAGHKAHALIMTPGVTQIIKYSMYRSMGPQHLGTDGKLRKIRGRWSGVHLHHLMDTVGTLIEGVVVRDGAAHAFVSHDSNDTVFRDCIAYNNKNTGFWWDDERVLIPNWSLPLSNLDYMFAPDQASTNVLWDHCMVALQPVSPGDSNLGEDGFLTAPSSGTMTDCVATGIRGSASTAGTVWSESAGGVWPNSGCVMHNNEVRGVYLWQNSDHAQLDGWVSFRNGGGGETHGAYSNNNHFNDCVAFQNGNTTVRDCAILAVSSGRAPTYRNVIQDCWYQATLVREHTLPPAAPLIVRNSHMGHVDIDEPMGFQKHTWMMWVENDCDEPEDFCNLAHPHAGNHVASSIRIPDAQDPIGSIHVVQRLDGTAWKLTPVAGSSTEFTAVDIPAFAFVVSTTSLTPGSVGTSYSQLLAYVMPPNSAVAPVTWGLRPESGPLPPGLTLSSAGLISGTPTTPGTYPIVVQAVDLSKQRARKTLAFVVGASAVLQITSVSLPQGTIGDAYNTTIQISGGVAAFTASIVSGSLPPGLSLGASTRALTGAPTTTGAYSFTVRVTDSTGATANRSFTVDVVNLSPSIVTTDLSDGELSLPYNAQVVAVAGVGPYTFTSILGPLPPSVGLSTSGMFSGTPTNPGVYPIRIQVTDSLGRTGIADFVIEIFPRFLMSPTPLPDATVGAFYSYDFDTTTGGKPPITFVGLGGDPPDGAPEGLVLSSTGIFSGIPTEAGSFTFAISAIDSLGVQITQDVTMDVAEAPLPLPYVPLDRRVRSFRFRGELLPSRGRPRS